MEANSLSDIIQLAANPPKYPRKPSERLRDDLTLYIARVPGSRDIILTTLKPQLKNVTAEDVAASLYYFHLNTEDDKHLVEDGIAEEPDVITQRPLVRKPLPESARSSIDFSRQPALSPATQSSYSTSPKRKPIIPSSSGSQIPAQIDQPIQRKPLGPRAPMVDHSQARKPLPGIENNLPGLAAQHPRNGGDGVQTFVPPEANSLTSGSISDAAGFSITIIRRDPSTGSQWNIGSIMGKPSLGDMQGGRETSPRRKKKPYFDISVHLTTPGYTCFRRLQTTGGAEPQDSNVPQQHLQLPSSVSFDREICMEGTSFWSRPSLQHKRTQSDITDSRARGSSSGDSQIIGSPEASSRRFDEQHDTGSSQSKGKGYVFYSPWGGRCKFSTGSGGRSLKCKHTLPASLSAHAIEGSSNSEAESMVVSELRFNLPSSAIFTPSASEKKDTDRGRSGFSKFGHIREKISPSKVPLPLPRDIEGSAEDMARLDLSIGREKAGGGNRGKRAKLGKIIIHHEGFKMLDLVVSANLGIWWSVWESDDR